jgi:Na+-driven multidrug efflux pump
MIPVTAIYIIWTPIQNLFMAFGDFKTPSIIQNNSSFLFVLFVYILVIFFKFHIFGVAISRCLVMALALIIGIIYLRKNE